MRVIYYQDRVVEYKSRIVDQCTRCNGGGVVTDTAFRFKLGKPTDNIREFLLRIGDSRKECICQRTLRRTISLIEANIPEDMWTVNHKSRNIKDVVVKDVTLGRRLLMSKIISAYINKLNEASKEGIGFVFCGPNGTGKTLFGCKILLKAIKDGYSSHYIFLDDLIDMLKSFDDEFVYAVIDEIYDVDFLFIDEIGKEIKTSKFVLTNFEKLLKQRRSRQKPTIFAMNLLPPELESIYGSLAISLMETNNMVLSFENLSDFRVDQGKAVIRKFFENE